MPEDSLDYVEQARARRAVRGPFGPSPEQRPTRKQQERAQREAVAVLAELDRRRKARQRRG